MAIQKNISSICWRNYLLDDPDLFNNAAVYLIDNRYDLEFVTANPLVLIHSGNEEKKWILKKALSKAH